MNELFQWFQGDLIRDFYFTFLLDFFILLSAQQC